MPGGQYLDNPETPRSGGPGECHQQAEMPLEEATLSTAIGSCVASSRGTAVAFPIPWVTAQRWPRAIQILPGGQAPPMFHTFDTPSEGMTKQLGINDLEIIHPPAPILPLTLSKSEGEPLILKGELLKQSLWGHLRNHCHFSWVNRKKLRFLWR